MLEDRPQLEIFSVTEHHETIAPPPLGVSSKRISPKHAPQYREGGRLMLLSVFGTLNRPRINDAAGESE